MQFSFPQKRKIFIIFLAVVSFFVFAFSFHPYTPVSYALSVTVPSGFQITPGTTIDPSTAKQKLQDALSPQPSEQTGFFSDFCTKYSNMCASIKSLFDNQEFYTSSPTGNGDTTNVPANGDTCNNHYDFNTVGGNGYNPHHQNFGDPNCEFANNPAQAKDSLLSLLKQLDNTHANIWFEMAQRESTYRPNIWAPPSTGTPDQGGAWGLFQMGQGSAAKPYDKGDVYWKTQANNAIMHLKLFETPNGFTTCDYWQAAKDINAANPNLGACFTLK